MLASMAARDGGRRRTGRAPTDLPRHDLPRTDLSRADLSGTDLSGTDPSRADPSGTDLSRTDLSLREAVHATWPGNRAGNGGSDHAGAAGSPRNAMVAMRFEDPGRPQARGTRRGQLDPPFVQPRLLNCPRVHAYVAAVNPRIREMVRS
jgi:hypothetical protein